MLLPLGVKSRITSVNNAKSLVLPGTPLVVYSVVKYSGWAGKCVRVQRSSDSTQQDIGFDNSGYIDITSANTFANGSNLTVVTLYDQSGNSYDATASGSSSPILRSLNTVFGIQPVTLMPATGNLSSAYFTIPSGVSLSRTSYAAYCAMAVGGGTFNSAGFWGLGTDATATNNVTLLYDASSQKVRWLDAAFHSAVYPQVGQASTMSLKCDGTNTKCRVNGVETSVADATAFSMLGGYLGQGSWTSAPYAASELFAFVLYATAPSGANDITIETNFASLFNVTLAPTEQVLLDGDSITAGYNEYGFLLNLPRQTNPLLSKRVGTYDIGVNGQSMATIYANSANAIAHYNGSLSVNLNHIFAGTNDIANAASGSIVGIGTTIFNNYLIPYVQAMQTAGFNNVIVGTMLPRLWTGSATDIMQRETERLAYNALILANNATYSYTVADYASLYTSNPTAYTTGGGSVDGIHPTVATYGNMAVICAAAINPSL